MEQQHWGKIPFFPSVCTQINFVGWWGRLNFPSWDKMLLSPIISALSHGSISRALCLLIFTTGFTLWLQHRPWGLSSQNLIFWGQVRRISSSAGFCRALAAATRFSSHIWGSPAEVSLRAARPAHRASFNHDSPTIYNSLLQRLEQPGSFQFQN